MLGRLDGGRPFLQLPAGHYRLEIRGDAGAAANGSPARAGGRNHRPAPLAGRPLVELEFPPRPAAAGGVQLAWRDFTSAELCCGAASFDFEVPTELALEGGQDIVIGLHLDPFGQCRSDH